MKFKVWSENSINEDDDNDKICYLRLENGEREASGRVLVRMVNKDGSFPKNSNIIIFDSNARCIILMSNINPDYYIKSDFKGYPIVVNEEEHDAYLKEVIEEIAIKELKKDFKRMLSKKEIEENTIQ